MINVKILVTVNAILNEFFFQKSNRNYLYYNNHKIFSLIMKLFIIKVRITNFYQLKLGKTSNNQIVCLS